MCSATMMWTSCAIAAVLPSLAVGSSALVNQKGSLRSSVDAGDFAKDVTDAMGKALGCGGQVSIQELERIEEQLRPVWRSLPKNDFDRIEKRMLRYLTYRYFMQESSMILRGFEPSQPANSSDWATADVLSRTVPGFVETVLQSKHKEQRGFDLRDAAYMIATLNQLVFDSESVLLQRAYDELQQPSNEPVGHALLQELLEEYLILWLIGDNPDGLRMIRAGRSLVTSAIPNWYDLTTLVSGQIKSFQHARQLEPRRGSKSLSNLFTFEDVHQVVGEITRTFASFWHSECATMKDALVKLDKHGTGRVPLSRFYSYNLGGEWRFGESEQYMREMGALDETSSWRGKQVLVPNYIQSASNCVVSHSHYLICCKNECVDILSDIEVSVGQPVAEPEFVWELVKNVSSLQGMDDEVISVPISLRKQLDDIADANGGQVPLHGRLFAQWLHFAFPRECAFPHKAGTANMRTPSEFGDSYTATEEEMVFLASSLNHSNYSAAVDKEDQQWMSLWSAEEELLADYASHRRFAWERTGVALMGGLLAVAAVAGIMGAGKKTSGCDLPLYGKSHLI